MEISKSHHNSRFKVHMYLNRDTQRKIATNLINSSHVSPKHLKVDSTSTTIENTKISNTLNNEILYHKLKNYSYKRAESELRQILNKSSIFREKSEEIKKKSSLSRNSNSILRPTVRYNSSLKNKEADLIINEYKSINNARVWESFLDNLRANPKHLLDLIPISLTIKAPKTSRSRLTVRASVSSKSTKKGKLIENSNQIIETKDISCGQTPDIIESLKENPINLTEDWAKSELHYNLKHNKGQLNVKPGLTQSEVESVLSNTPSSKAELEELLQKLFMTIERLLIELLGTQDDLDKFKEVYAGSSPSIIRALCVKCVDLYRFRTKTLEILTQINYREKALRTLSRPKEEKKAVIEVHKCSKKIRELINQWLKDECVPFNRFIYKGQDYVEKINKDLISLQHVLISKS